MKRNILILLVSLIVLIVMILVIRTRTNNNVIKTEITEDDIKFDENTNLYYLKDESTGEIINANMDLESFEIYKIDPEYNPNPLIPKSTELSDFISSDEEILEENDN